VHRPTPLWLRVSPEAGERNDEGCHRGRRVDAQTDQILGAQAVGTEGVDKRIDVLATAMAARMRASDLLRLELAYAPQYGTAKDPVNMLGYMAENLTNGTTANIQWHEVEAARAAGAAVVDVRTAAEFAAAAMTAAC
jgi:hypothetical protein